MWMIGLTMTGLKRSPPSNTILGVEFSEGSCVKIVLSVAPLSRHPDNPYPLNLGGDNFTP